MFNAQETFLLHYAIDIIITDHELIPNKQTIPPVAKAGKFVSWLPLIPILIINDRSLFRVLDTCIFF